MDEENLKNAGVKQLMKQGLIIEVVLLQPELTDIPATVQPLGEKAPVSADIPSEIVQPSSSAEIPVGPHEETPGDTPAIPGEEPEALKPDPVRPVQKRQRR